MKKLEKLFTQLELAKNKEEREDWIYQIKLQIEENQEFVDLIIKFIYKLLVSTNWENRKAGSLIFNDFCKYLEIKIPPEFYQSDENFNRKYKEIREKELTEYFRGDKLFKSLQEFKEEYKNLYKGIKAIVELQRTTNFFSCEESIFDESLINTNTDNLENIAKELKLNIKIDDTKFIKQLEGEEKPKKQLSRQQTLMMKRKKTKTDNININLQSKPTLINDIQEFFKVTHLNLTNENWNIRHGAFLTYCGLIDYLISNKKFNQTYGSIDNEKKISVNKQNQSTEVRNKKEIILSCDLIIKSLEILYLDRLSDFNLDITKAPVRDASSLLISQLIDYTNYDYVIYNLINLIVNNINNWQTQLSGLICLKRIQTKLTDFDRLYILYLMLQISYFGTDDDVKVLTAEFIKDNFYLLKSNNIISPEILLNFNKNIVFPSLEKYLWSEIIKTNFISISIVSYLMLLDEIYKETKSIDENQLKILSTFCRSQIMEIRLGVVVFFKNEFPTKYHKFIYGILIQNLLIETDTNILELTKECLLNLNFHSFLFVVTKDINEIFQKEWFGLDSNDYIKNIESLDPQFTSGGLKSIGDKILTENRLRYFEYLNRRNEVENIREDKPKMDEKIESTLYYLIYKLIKKDNTSHDLDSDSFKNNSSELKFNNVIKQIEKEDFIETRRINTTNWIKMNERGSLCSLNLEYNAAFLNFLRVKVITNILNGKYSDKLHNEYSNETNNEVFQKKESEYKNEVLYVYIKNETCKEFLKLIFRNIIKNGIKENILKELTEKCMNFEKNVYIFFQSFSYEFLKSEFFFEMKNKLINSSLGIDTLNIKRLNNLKEKNIQNFFIQTLPFYEKKEEMDFLFFYCLEIKNIKENFIFAKQILKTFCKNLKYNFLIIKSLIKLLKEGLENFLKNNYEKQQAILLDFSNTELYYILSLINVCIQNHNSFLNPLLLNSIITSINILGNEISYICLSELIPTLQNSITEKELMNINKLEMEGINLKEELMFEKNKIEKFFNTKKISANINPKIKTGILREYQIEGIQWLNFLYELGANGILADDMGLGKTLQILSLITIIKQKEKKFLSLIICPNSIIGHWEDEIKKFTDLKFKIISRFSTIEKNNSFDIIVSTFDTIRFFFTNVKDNIVKSTIFDYLVIDEAHVIKNPETKIYKTICQLKAKNKMLLTGTPVQNSVNDIINLFNFIMPNYLKNDYKNLQEIHKKTLPFILRRLKTNVLKDLPEKIVMDIQIDLLKEQREFYNSLAPTDYISYSNYKENKKSSSFQIINKQLKICSNPEFFGIKNSAKLIALHDLFTVETKKILIFFQYKRTLNTVSFSLPKNSFLILDGSIPVNNRQEVVNNFNTDLSISYLLLTTSIGGLGLNLTSASTVIFYEHDWNPFNDLQAMDRAHRIGQKDTVNVYRLICKNTIEERIMSLQNFKKHVAETLVNQQNFNVESMDMENFLERFNTEIKSKIQENKTDYNEEDEVLDLY